MKYILLIVLIVLIFNFSSIDGFLKSKLNSKLNPIIYNSSDPNCIKYLECISVHPTFKKFTCSKYYHLCPLKLSYDDDDFKKNEKKDDNNNFFNPCINMCKKSSSFECIMCRTIINLKMT